MIKWEDSVRGVLCILMMVLTVGTSAKPYLTDGNISSIRENWPDYEYAAKLVGVPVLALAAIHYREADLYKGWYFKKRQRVVKNVGGPFMLDLGPLNDGGEFTRRIRLYEKEVHDLYGLSGPVLRVSHDFRFSAIVAAHHLKTKAKCLMESVDCLALALWGYNGRASWHVDGRGVKTHKESSYVWSNPAKDTKLVVRYTDKGGNTKEHVDMRPGVMIIINELKRHKLR